MAATDQEPELAVKRWLVDTGAFVAYLDSRDRHNESVAGRLDAFVGQLITTAAVVTEVMYFVADAPDGPMTFAELLGRTPVSIVPLGDAQEVAAAAALMGMYADTPMDFADATLVLAGNALGVADILTLDRRGFSTYRLAKHRPFRLVLDA